MRQPVGSAIAASPGVPVPADVRRPHVEGASPEVGPSVDIRIVLFTVADARLRVALRDGARRPALPRAAPGARASLDAEARRIVGETTALREQYLEQLYTVSAREETGWTVIVAYLGLICSGQRAPALQGAWHPADDLPAVGDTDGRVIDYAVARLRAKLGYTTIAFHLLPPTFTLSELQSAYEAILGHALDKRNFRRRLIAAAILESTGEQRRDGSHRPALLYRFRAGHDRETFLTPAWAESA